MYSAWLKTDLHIHSIASNKTKDNDYDGKEYDADKLISTLKQNEVNLFSITDHNTLNIILYDELLSKQADLASRNMNFIIGVEMDILDKEIHDEVFHLLVYFESRDINTVAAAICRVFNVEKIDCINKTTSPPNLTRLYKEIFKDGSINNIITIPHFHNKKRGLPSNDEMDSLVYTVFNALEDSNNRDNLIKSIRKFKEYSYNDVPLVVFSDNHNIDIYPQGKDKKEEDIQTTTYLLGNAPYPFSSIKTAFQDVNTRICIDGADNRQRTKPKKYITSICVDNCELKLSEYQNTIIGGFGTGKSFLLDLIQKGKNGVNAVYKDLADQYQTISLTFSDGTKRDSLVELGNDINVVKFDQYKDIYFLDYLDVEAKEKLENNLHIEFSDIDVVEPEEEQDLIDGFNNYTELVGQIISDRINYEVLEQRSNKPYSIEDSTWEEVYSEPEYLESLKDNLDKENLSRVLSKEKYLKSDKETIADAKKIISLKNDDYIKVNKKMVLLQEKLDEKIKTINGEVKATNEQLTSTIAIVQKIKEFLMDYKSIICKFKILCDDFEEKYSEKEYSTIINRRGEVEYKDYNFITGFKSDTGYKPYRDDILKSEYRNGTFFQGVVDTLRNNGTFAQSKTFPERIDHYLSEYYSSFKNIFYDIEENSVSIMNKSAGEKANVFMKLIFDVIGDYYDRDEPTIVLIDQPEDNLDNKGILNEVVGKIRTMKTNNRLPQFICVTHNANISITADSENIIIAKKEGGKCEYSCSGIENEDFIIEVCNTVEGGADALKKRGIKFNIPMIKELDRGV